MNDVIALSFFLTLGRAASALLMLLVLLRLLDRVVGFSFKEWINDATPHDIAVYLGLRFLGGAILFGQIFS